MSAAETQPAGLTRDELARIAGRLMRCPAVPYYEETVRSEVERICDENGLAYRRDAYGNVLVRVAIGSKLRPLVLAAHMDHPGFRIMRGLRQKAWLAEFLGGVPDEYFQAGIPLRLQPGDTPARLGKRVGATPRRHYEIIAQRLKYSRPAFAVWDVTDFELRGEHIRGRSCDDLVGVATALAVLIVLKRRGERCHVQALISRAEEVGFHGALAGAAQGTIPGDSLVLSLETSRELPPARMGQGVIIRVGDRTSIFNSEATQFLGEVAMQLQSGGSFKFQRALMSGGTCEATAYQGLGFQTGALCVALGNYHNCAPRRRIAAEYIHLDDAASMVELLVNVARQMPNYPKLVQRLQGRLQTLLGDARKQLK